MTASAARRIGEGSRRTKWMRRRWGAWFAGTAIAVMSFTGCSPSPQGTNMDDDGSDNVTVQDSSTPDSDELTAVMVRAAAAKAKTGQTSAAGSSGGSPNSNKSPAASGASASSSRENLVSLLADLDERRKDEFSVVVYDRTTGRTLSYNDDDTYCTASIMKVTLMAALLYKDERAGKPVTAQQKQLLTRMIENSDNTAATQIWNILGRGPGIAPLLHRWGMTHTVVRSDGYWGLTRTTAGDQIRILNVITSKSGGLNAADRQLALSLMEHVEADQRWGVSAGVSSSATVALKNGWSPADDDNWRINSIGVVNGGGRDYEIAVLSIDNPTEDYGIATVSEVSEMVWQALAPVTGDSSP